ncbi:pyrimidine dimer DNA glycosylase/endonuclease V [Glutamicibacter uratoxydans]|uniref:pyrimidine dimer DNA glycosylase/endonuclease V n=1 Tax=Glutamicibacter uratoxydans TaxID=43667 RepID=UPI001142EC3B|nr:pyrimidine dimer DNA glycosylase/endonuclease V [Glutamicibacter uratoxydans]
MRLWSLHPSLLDAKGLVACWRETLLAQKVLAGETRGYTEHPQLVRFKEQPEPLVAIGHYLQGIWDEAQQRGYHFDASKILRPPQGRRGEFMELSSGQRDIEREHLLGKLMLRDPARAAVLEAAEEPALHQIFFLVPGPAADWEKAGVSPR